MKKKIKKGIVATLMKGVRSVYPRGARRFYFDTVIQGEAEMAMTYMGFDCCDYYLSWGKLEEIKAEEVKKS